MSADTNPPFIPRYLTTRHEAENHLFGLNHVKATSLRPGFVYSY